MYAIIESGGRQYKVAPGETIKIERLSLDDGADVTLDKVLMVRKDDKSVYGAPYVEGAKVVASIEGTTKARKLVVHKQRPRKVYRKTNGHRQLYTSVKIKEIVFGG